jgi:hypothetical protein
MASKCVITIKKKAKYRRRNELVRKRRAELIMMAGAECADCHWGYGDFMFDLHHVDPSKKRFTLTGKNLTRRWTEVLTEFNNCVLLCPNCHRIRHWEMK